MQGDKDPNVSAEQTAAIYQALRGHKELHTFTGLGHEPYLFKRREEWKEKVGRFVGDACKPE
jgi:fermentation-respiration switch protein FrsA (DUF1100 family)